MSGLFLCLVTLLVVIVATLVMAVPPTTDSGGADAPQAMPVSALDFTATGITGGETPLSKYAGRVVLVVNVASKCGYTKQYADLQQLHEKYADQGLAIVGFPCNQFGGQEPGSEAQIQEFCTVNFGVTFDLFAKVEVNGEQAHPLFRYLTSDQAPVADRGPVKWNFEKFLIDRQGKLIGRYRSKASPTGVEMVAAIEKALADSQPKEAVLAGGCFWCTEAVFEQLDGVLAVEAGYAGGKERDATYDQVSRGSTDHAEAIRIFYDPSRVSYQKLLEVFFTVAHDPTQLNRQGNDVGRQYRSTVFHADDQQKQAAQEMIRRLTEQKKYDKPIVTTLEPLEVFYPAEAYHQDYARRNPDNPYIRGQAMPKVMKLQEKLPDAIRRQE